MAILLVRHGETPSNRDRIMQVEATPLSARGERQAQLLAERLSALGVARILCSDLVRARLTAEPLAARTGAPLSFSPLLRERDFGALRGLPYSTFSSDPFARDYVPPEGESWQVFHARVAQAFAQICATPRAAGENLVVITHGLVLQAILQRHVAWPEGSGGAPPEQLANTSVTSLANEPPHAPTLVNCCAHLGQPAHDDPIGGAA